jgi:hypothetical protein
LLLILTNSIDGTADILAHLCAGRDQPVFRFNIDLWLDYKFAWTPGGFAIRDPSGRMLDSNQISACLWRRPSLQLTPEWRGGSKEDRAATETELHAVMWEIAGWLRSRGRLRLIEPTAQRRVGKISQMRVASRFFPVPDWSVGWGFRFPAGKRMVKRFAPGAVGEQRDRYIYVQSVDAERLSPDFPWFTQEIGRGVRDATILYINGTCFGFEARLTRAELGVEDWRTLPESDSRDWRPWALAKSVQKKMTAYMNRLGLYFGRLDFLTDGGEITFLEVNPNGQFGWLDEPKKWPLHNAVLDAALDPASTVKGDETIREVN